MNDRKIMIKDYSKKIMLISLILLTMISYVNVCFAAAKNNDLMSIIDRMIEKSATMGYSIYIVLAIILLLVLTTIITWRNKVLSIIVMIISGSACAFMLYYLASDLKMSIFWQINDLLSGVQALIINLGGSSLLVVVVVGFVLSLFSKKSSRRRRGRGFSNNDDGYDDYDYADDD